MKIEDINIQIIQLPGNEELSLAFYAPDKFLFAENVCKVLGWVSALEQYLEDMKYKENVDVKFKTKRAKIDKENIIKTCIEKHNIEELENMKDRFIELTRNQSDNYKVKEVPTYVAFANAISQILI